VGAELANAVFFGKFRDGDVTRGGLTLGLEGDELALQGLDLLLHRGFALQEGFDVLGFDGLLQVYGTELRQPSMPDRTRGCENTTGAAAPFVLQPMRKARSLSLRAPSC
jgi:hypothetical protein